MLDHPLRGTIEIDEAALTSKRKGLNGRIPYKMLWVFGLFCRESKSSYIFLIPNRRTDIIFMLIDYFVESGSIIISDQFSLYVNKGGNTRILQKIPEKSFHHYWTNHSYQWTNALDPQIHTNNIERTWREMRKVVRRNVDIRSITNYLNTFIFQTVVHPQDRYSTIMHMLITHKRVFEECL